MFHITDEKLAAFVNKNLSNKENEKIKQHLQKCTECFDFYVQMKRILSESKEAELQEVPAHIFEKAKDIPVKSQSFYVMVAGPAKKLLDSILLLLKNSIEFLFINRVNLKLAYAFVSLIIIGASLLFILKPVSPIENIILADVLTISSDGPLGFVGDMEKIEYTGMYVKISEDGNFIIFFWPEVQNAMFYQVFLTEKERQRITPPEGIQSTQFSYQIKNIDINTKYIWEILGKLKDGRIFQAKAIFIRNK
jgi:hypothetical protein